MTICGTLVGSVRIKRGGVYVCLRHIGTKQILIINKGNITQILRGWRDTPAHIRGIWGVSVGTYADRQYGEEWTHRDLRGVTIRTIMENFGNRIKGGI